MLWYYVLSIFKLCLVMEVKISPWLEYLLLYLDINLLAKWLLQKETLHNWGFPQFLILHIIIIYSWYILRQTDDHRNTNDGGYIFIMISLFLPSSLFKINLPKLNFGYSKCYLKTKTENTFRTNYTLIYFIISHTYTTKSLTQIIYSVFTQYTEKINWVTSTSYIY